MLTNKMAYSSAEEMMFGTALHPIRTRHGLSIGSGYVILEIVPHPRSGSEKSLKTLLREFERANYDILERCVNIGIPQLLIEIEQISQMTNMPEWGAKVTEQTIRQIDDFSNQYGLIAGCRATIADIRKPDSMNIRDSEATTKVLSSFELCAKSADIVSIESIGGKEISDHALIRNDITGLLFGQAVLGSRDVAWLWNNITTIVHNSDCIAGGDTDCAQANTAMFMAGGYLSKNLPHTLATLSRAIGAARTLVAYESGAIGPGKDCAYENPIIKAILGITIAMEGKSSACAHSDLCGNVTASVCDLWSNEAVEYHQLFGGSTGAVFTEILGYDVAAMNSAVELGFQKEFQACLVNSDRFRDPQAFILCPDNAWLIGKAIVDNNASYYSRARAAAITAGELVLAESNLYLSEFEETSLKAYLTEIEGLPENEGDFIDLCLTKYRNVKGFLPAAYGL